MFCCTRDATWVRLTRAWQQQAHGLDAATSEAKARAPYIQLWKRADQEVVISKPLATTVNESRRNLNAAPLHLHDQRGMQMKILTRVKSEGRA